VSDGGRWRRVYCLEWHEAALQGLSDAERVVYFYAKTSQQSTSVGIFRMSTAVAVEDLGNVTSVEFDYRLDRVCQAFEWRFDPVTRVLWIPNWIHDNPPQSPNVCKSWRKLLANLPDCDLKYEAVAAVAHALKDMPLAFRETIATLPKDSRISKAKPKPKTEANQGAGEQGIRGSGDQRTRTGSRTTTTSEPINGGASTEVPAHLLKTARQTLKLNPGGTPEGKVDAFKDIHRSNGGGNVDTPDVLAALNVALAERRTVQ
jgi:hypothetical protein